MKRFLLPIQWFLLAVIAFGAVLVIFVYQSPADDTTSALIVQAPENTNTELPTNTAAEPVEVHDLPAMSDSGLLEISSITPAVVQNGWRVAIAGQANVFENTVNYVVGTNGTVLASGYETTQGSMGEMSAFEITTAVFTAKTPAVTIQVFSTSAKDGLRENVVSVDLALPLAQ